MMECKICGKCNEVAFTEIVLDQFKVDFFHCDQCDFLQTEEPFWLEKAYNESINISDTGVLSRNIQLSKISSLVICAFFDKNKMFLDFAGGYGIFTRLMRDIGFNFYWCDKYSENLVSRGFEYESRERVELVTTFESFEHFEYPMREIEEMLNKSESILFSTELFEGGVPKPKNWTYYGFGHGQHISFYSIKTLRYIAKKYNLRLNTNGRTIHLLTKKIIPNVVFVFLLKLCRLGAFNIVKMGLRSKTMDDWSLLK